MRQRRKERELQGDATSYICTHCAKETVIIALDFAATEDAVETTLTRAQIQSLPRLTDSHYYYYYYYCYYYYYYDDDDDDYYSILNVNNNNKTRS